MAGIGSHTRPNEGETTTWLTPPSLIEALGPFDLDPCCPPTMPWRTAEQMIHFPEDGLAAEWKGRVWLNPPYTQAVGKWLEKLAAHPGGGVALVFARTEVEWFHRWVWGKADAVLFPEGRLHFHHPDGSRARGNAGGPSVLAAYGRYNSRRLMTSGITGKFLPLWAEANQDD